MSLVVEELVAAQRSAAADAILRTASAAYDGPIIVLKGPSAAAYYPQPVLRPFTDLDILVEDAAGAQRALVAAGFEPVGPYGDGYYDGLHHRRPLHRHAQDPLLVEVHARPNWVEWVDAPDVRELFSVAVPGPAGIDGVLTLPAPQMALVLAAHSWLEAPLRRLLDLVDVAAIVADADRGELDELARRWGLAKMARTTLAAADALAYGDSQPWSLRLWARDLAPVRDPSVLDTHLRSWLSPFWALPAHRAIAATITALGRDLTPAPSETWRRKLDRTRGAVLHPGRSEAEHRQLLGPENAHPRLDRH